MTQIIYEDIYYNCLFRWSQEEIFDDFKCTLRTASVANAANGVTDFIGRSIGGLIEQVGHIYLTEEHICFSGNMLAETKLVSKQRAKMRGRTVLFCHLSLMKRIQID